MATYHLEVKAHSRANGRNAVALSSYRSGESLRLHSEGKVRNCRRHEKSDVLHCELINSRGLSREEIWNKAENSERRKDAVVARELEVALPSELSFEEQRNLAMSLSNDIAERYNCVVDLAVHAPDDGGDNRNYHAHILFASRGWGEGQDFAKKKYRSLDRNAEEVNHWRELWQEKQNSAYEEAGLDIRVSSATCEEQGKIKKYQRFTYKKYAVLQQYGELEEAKEYSRYQLIEAKELEIEDLLGELKSLQEEQQNLGKEKEDIDEDNRLERDKKSSSIQVDDDASLRLFRGKNDFFRERLEEGFGERIKETRGGLPSGNGKEIQLNDQGTLSEPDRSVGADNVADRKGSKLEQKYAQEIRRDLESIISNNARDCEKFSSAIRDSEQRYSFKMGRMGSGVHQSHRSRCKQIDHIDKQSRECNTRAQHSLGVFKRAVETNQGGKLQRQYEHRSYLGRIDQIGRGIRNAAVAIKSSIEVISAFISRTRNKEFVKTIANIIAPAFRNYKTTELVTSIQREKRPEFPTPKSKSVNSKIPELPKIKIFDKDFKVKSKLEKIIDPESYREKQFESVQKKLNTIIQSPRKNQDELFKKFSIFISQIEKQMSPNEKESSFVLQDIKRTLDEEMGNTRGKFSSIKMKESIKRENKGNDRGMSF
jgi:hypothetical protein